MVVVAGLALALASIEQRLLGQPIIEALVLAMLAGLALRNVLAAPNVAMLKTGADLSAKQILEVAVGLLGASVYFPELLKAGPVLLGFVIGGVACTILVSFALGRLLGLGPKLAVLVAVGNSICGNSAIAAVAPVIDADQRDVASAIGLTAVIGVLLVLGLPFLIVPFALSNYQFGVLAGMSVYAVPQVVAAAFPISQLSGEVATLVKLTRVLLLGPVVLLLSCLYAGRRTPQAMSGPKRGIGAYVPWFVAVFLGLAVIRSLGVLPDFVAQTTQDLSRLLMIVAMAGLGFGVQLAAVRKVGPRVAVAVIGSLLFLAALTLTFIRVASI
jgi:uncharacterized integral membrane protein (TIGR00698 family)